MLHYYIVWNMHTNVLASVQCHSKRLQASVKLKIMNFSFYFQNKNFNIKNIKIFSAEAESCHPAFLFLMFFCHILVTPIVKFLFLHFVFRICILFWFCVSYIFCM